MKGGGEGGEREERGRSERGSEGVGVEERGKRRGREEKGARKRGEGETGLRGELNDFERKPRKVRAKTNVKRRSNGR